MWVKTFKNFLFAVAPSVINHFYSTRGKTHKATKPIDRSHFTQGMHDFAVIAYQEYLNNKQNKSGGIRTQRELTDFLNDAFGTDKSVTTMAHLFKGDIKRDTLAPGYSYLVKAEKEVLK